MDIELFGASRLEPGAPFLFRERSARAPQHAVRHISSRTHVRLISKLDGRPGGFPVSARLLLQLDKNTAIAGRDKRLGQERELKSSLDLPSVPVNVITTGPSRNVFEVFVTSGLV